MWGLRTPPIGLDLGRSSIKMLQFGSADAGLRIAAAARFDLTDEPPSSPDDLAGMLADTLRRLLDASSFRSRQVAIALSDYWLTYDPAARVKTDTDASIGASIPIGGPDSQEAITVRADGTVIDAVIRAAESVRLAPVCIEPSPTAIARALYRGLRRQADHESLRCVLDLGAASTRLLLLRAGDILAYTSFDVGGLAITRAIAECLGTSRADAADVRRSGLDDDQATSDAAQVALRAAEPLLDRLAGQLNSEISNAGAEAAPPLQLVGGHAHERWLRDALATRLSLELSEATPLSGVETSDPEVQIERRGSLCGWTVAAGAALRSPISHFRWSDAA